ncbi:MAG: recombinase family protein, partial [Ruminococcus sp.]|nr:recombinase family protein [Ruminococcus sp.]
FQRMIKDCRKGKIDRIYTKSISRFARNTRDCLKNIRELKSLGITIYFEKENLDTANMTDEMMITIMGGLAQEESVSISQNIQWSIKNRMKNGTYIVSNVPFGYRKANGRFVICEEEAEIVRRIYAEFLQGHGLNSICDILNQEGKVMGKSGCIWRKKAVRYILTNEKYIGDCLWRKKITENVFPFKKSRNNGQAEQYYVSGSHDPIVSRADFETVQSLLAQKSEYFGHTEFHEYPLSRKMICENCGSTYRRKRSNNKTYWVCLKHDLNAAECSSKWIAEYKIYNAFTVLHNKLRHNYKQILVPLQTALQELKIRRFNVNSNVMDIHKEIAKLREQTHVLARLKTKGFLDNAKYLEQTTELTAKINKLQSELKKLTHSDDNDETLEQIEMLTDYFEKCKNPITEFEASVFESIVEKIVVINQHELKFHLIGGLKFREKI